MGSTGSPHAPGPFRLRADNRRDQDLLDETQLEGPHSTCPDLDVASLRCSLVERELSRIPPTLALQVRRPLSVFPLSCVQRAAHPPKQWTTQRDDWETYGGLSPEQEQFLSSGELLRVDFDGRLLSDSRRQCNGRMDDPSLEEYEGDRSDAAAVRFERAVAPGVIPFKATAANETRAGCERRVTYCNACSLHRAVVASGNGTHLMQSMSMRCCSATLFSRLTLRCNAVKMLLRSSNADPQSTLSLSKAWFGLPVSSVPATSTLSSAPGVPLGGMAKYSSSSRRTMMACLRNSGFWRLACEGGVDSDRSRRGPCGGP